MSLTELETLHQLCELERTQILQSLALAALKIPNAGYFLSGNRSNFVDIPKKYFMVVHLYQKSITFICFEDKRCYKKIRIFYKKSTLC